MKRFFSLLAFAILILCIDLKAQSATTHYPDDVYYRVEIINQSDQTLSQLYNMGLAVDHVHQHESKNGQFVVIAELAGFELNMMLEAGVEFEILMEDMATYYEQRILKDLENLDIESIKSAYDTPDNFQLGSFAGHKTFAEVVTDLDLMRMMFPNLISQKISIGKSIENRDVWAIWIGKDFEENKPQALYTAITHAREPNSMSAVLYYMWWLLENYGEDETATFILNNRHLAFIPVLNPDGYEHNRMTNPNGGGMHRKNRRPVNAQNIGVDLNRNFGPFDFWDHPNGGSSTFPNSDIYRGTAPFSEPETAALRDFVNANDFRTAFNYHTYSNLLVYPYGALNRVTIDNHIFQGYAIEMTQHNGYVYGTDQETVGYNTRGNSDDFMYGYETGNPKGRKKIIAYTPEVGMWSDGFWPSPSRIIPLSNENVHPNILLALYSGPELRYDENMVPEPDQLTLDVGTENYLSFSMGDLYNYGRYELESAELRITTDFEGAILQVDTINLPVIMEDETFSGLTDAFIIEFEPWAQSGAQLNLTLELSGPWMRQQATWDYIFVTDGTPTSNPGVNDVPVSFHLFDNYPNPFNPITQIRFTLQETERVSLSVFDSMGRKVRTLINENRSKGEHRVSFDGTGLSSGMYFYRLEAGNQVMTRKMTLLK